MRLKHMPSQSFNSSLHNSTENQTQNFQKDKMGSFDQYKPIEVTAPERRIDPTITDYNKLIYNPNSVRNTRYNKLTFLPLALLDQLKQPMNIYFIVIASLQSFPNITPVNPLSTWVPLLVIFSFAIFKEFVEFVSLSRKDAKQNSKYRSVFRRVNMNKIPPGLVDEFKMYKRSIVRNQEKDYEDLDPARKKKFLFFDDLKTIDNSSINSITGNKFLQHTTVFRKMRIQTCQIMVGDIVEVVDGEDFPCDLSLIYTERDDDICFISTANLDGETNFKSKSIPNLKEESNETEPFYLKRLPESIRRSYSVEHYTQNGKIHRGESEDKILEFEEYFYCKELRCKFDAPTPDIHVFNGSINKTKITFSQFLPGTGVLKNTRRILGVAVYTGTETKFGLSTVKTKLKTTDIDRKINRFVILLFIFQLLLSIIFGLVGYYANETDKFSELIVLIARFILLNSTMIPISLKVSLDLFKLLHAKFIGYDQTLGINEDAAQANNTNIPESLGQIELILSDKTGTLTENKMVLKELSYNGNHCKISNQRAVDGFFYKGDNEYKEVEKILLYNIITNNTVLPRNYEYEYTSPDELAMVKAGDSLPMQLKMRTNSSVHINNEKTIQVDSILEFTPDRKCSSIIIRDPDNDKHLVLCKGADEVMGIKYNKGKIRNTTLEEADKFAAEGYRAFCFGYKYLNEEEIKMLGKLSDPSTNEEEIDKIKNELEAGLDPCGVGAIEDKLQSQVPEVVDFLNGSGVRFWLITGDKFSTAQEIAKNANIIKPEIPVIVIEDFKEPPVDYTSFTSSKLKTNSYSASGNTDSSSTIRKESLRSYLDSLYNTYCKNTESTNKNYDSLKTNLNTDTMHDKLLSIKPTREKKNSKSHISLSKDKSNNKTIPVNYATNSYSLVIRSSIAEELYAIDKSKFSALCDRAFSCVFARTAPKSKANLVDMAKNSRRKVLAIGDGGNDVAMLRVADVSVGIRGLEGLQAANSADYQTNDFKSLKNLLIFHGLNTYRRLVRIIEMSFYKSIYFCTFQLMFNIFAQFSGASIFDTLSITLYNSFLFWPIFFLTFDLEVKKGALDKKAMKKYRANIKGTPFNMLNFLGWIFRGIIQGVFTILTVFYLYRFEYPLYEVGFILFFIFLSTVLITIVSEARTINPFLIIISILSGGASIIILIIFSLYKGNTNVANYGAAVEVFSDWNMYFVAMSITFIQISSMKIYALFWRLKTRE